MRFTVAFCFFFLALVFSFSSLAAETQVPGAVFGESISALAACPISNQYAFSLMNFDMSTGNATSCIAKGDLTGYHRISGTDGASGTVNCLEWSPDGTKIAYILASNSGNSALMLLDSNESVSQILTSSERTFNVLSWSGNGLKLYYSTTDIMTMQTNIMSITLSSGAIQTEIFNAEYPSVSPDNLKLAYSTFENDSSVKNAMIKYFQGTTIAASSLSSGFEALFKSWSADSSELYYMVMSPNEVAPENAVSWISKFSDSGIVTVVDSSKRPSMFSLAPDLSGVAYETVMSQTNSTLNFRVLKFASGTEIQYSGVFPIWTSDAKYIVWSKPDMATGSWVIMYDTVPVSSGPDLNSVTFTSSEFVSLSEIQLSWDDQQPNETHEYLIRSSLVSDPTQINFNGIYSASPAIVSGLSAGTSYNFFISKRIIGTTTEGPISEPFVVDIPQAPPVVEGLSFVFVDSTSVMFSWQGQALAAPYEYVLWSDNGSGLKEVACCQETSKLVSGLVPGAMYQFTICSRIIGTDIRSLFLSPFLTITIPRIPPQVTSAQLTFSSSSGGIVTWDDVKTGTERYLLSWTDQSTSIMVASEFIDVAEYEVSGLSSATTYQLAVWIVNPVTGVIGEKYIWTTTSPDEMTAVTMIDSFVMESDTSGKISWIDPSPESGVSYSLLIDTGAGEWINYSSVVFQ